ncbi:MAG: hypothetical protein ACP5UD_08370 [Conexivisphaera sp.]
MTRVISFPFQSSESRPYIAASTAAFVLLRMSLFLSPLKESTSFWTPSKTRTSTPSITYVTGLGGVSEALR